MLGNKPRGQFELLMAGSLRDLVPDDHVLARVDRVLDLSWLRGAVQDCYAADGSGRPGIDPEAALRLMLAGFLLGIVHDRRLLRETQVNIANRSPGYPARFGFAGLHGLEAGMTLAIKRMELDAAALRRASARSRDADAARRMLALALVLDGHDRTEAAALCGMDRETLRDWVHRYNEFGLAGLSSRIPAGPKPRLTPAQEAEVAAMVRAGPSLAEHGVVRWRRMDLSRVIETRFSVHLAERSVGDMLRRLGFRRLTARPRHVGHDADAQEAQKNLADLVAAAIPEHARGKPIELWWQDGRAQVTHDRVGQQGTLTRLWAKRGSRPAAPRDCRYAWAYLFGAVCPARGVSAALVLPYVNTSAMNLHLAEISRHVSRGAPVVVTIDGAGWHQPGGLLKVPNNISLLPLPPYSPQLNPQGNIWQYLRQNYLSNRVYDAIIDACCHAWNRLAAQPDRITFVATRSWAGQVIA